MVISSNTSNIEYEKLNNEDKIKFQNTLKNSMIYLAKEVVRDGEGASKFITVNVQGLRNTQDAKKLHFV